MRGKSCDCARMAELGTYSSSKLVTTTSCCNSAEVQLPGPRGCAHIGPKGLQQVIPGQLALRSCKRGSSLASLARLLRSSENTHLTHLAPKGLGPFKLTREGDGGETKGTAAAELLQKPWATLRQLMGQRNRRMLMDSGTSLSARALKANIHTTM